MSHVNDWKMPALEHCKLRIIVPNQLIMMQFDAELGDHVPGQSEKSLH